MRSTIKLWMPVMAGLLFVQSCNREKPERPVTNPILEITVGDITVAPSGEECSVTYTVANEVEGGTVSAQSPADWIGNLDYSTEGVVTFTVRPNDSGADRSSELIVVYAYGDDLEVRDSVSILQPVEVPAYDYELEAQVLTGVYYGTKNGQNGEYSYYVTFSDLPYAEDGYGQPGGTYYVFDLFGPAPEEGNNPMLPLGTYTLGEPGATAEFTFTPEYSGGFSAGPDGNIGDMYSIFAEGTLEFDRDGDGNYVMTATLTDTDGKSHHICYTGGSGTWRDESLPPYGTIDDDVDFMAVAAFGEFVKASGQDMMSVYLHFSDKPFDENGNVASAYVLTLLGWTPYDVSGNVGAGEYEITYESGVVFGLTRGIFTSGVPDGSYIAYYDENGYPSYALITSGTMSLKNWSGYYEISWNFMTEDGNSVIGSYAGGLTVDMPDEFSSLTDDKTLDLSGAVASGTYYGDWYVNGGGNWQLKIVPPLGVTEGDGIQIDLVAERLGFETGIPSGTYKAGAEGYPYPAYPEVGEYRRGFLEYGFLSGTGYMGAFNGLGQPGELAPATEGDLIVTANEDGTYTIKFSFLDDKGHTWDGEWTGPIALDKYMFAGDAPMKVAPEERF